MSVVAISCDQSANNEASPMPSTVRLSQRGRARGELTGRCSCAARDEVNSGGFDERGHRRAEAQV